MAREGETGGKKGQSTSTLAYLHPSFMDELRFGYFKDSLSVQGSYRMNLRQPNRQPEHSREYQPGDPIRLIDWKAFAKHDQLIVREIQDEASAQVSIVIDASESMKWPDEGLSQKLQRITKLQCAIRVGMAISYAHLKVGDQIKVIYTENGKPKFLFKPRSSTDIAASFDRINRAKFTEKSMFLECQSIQMWPTKFDRTYVISDLLFAAEDIGSKLQLPEAKSVKIYHLLSSLETQTEWIENDSFYHDEALQAKEYQGRTLTTGAAYENELSKWQQGLRQFFKKKNYDYIKITENTSVSSFIDSLQRG